MTILCNLEGEGKKKRRKSPAYGERLTGGVALMASRVSLQLISAGDESLLARKAAVIMEGDQS